MMGQQKEEKTLVKDDTVLYLTQNCRKIQCDILKAEQFDTTYLYKRNSNNTIELQLIE